MFLWNQSRVIEVKVNVYSRDGKVSDTMELPSVFSSELRTDLIRRAHRAISLSLRQPWGSKPFAGMRQVGHNLGANHGIARLPRVSGGNRGVILASMVGGRSAHSPRTDRNLYVKINRKERKMAHASALAFTASLADVRKRGHRIPEDLTVPVVVDSSVTGIKKSKDAVNFLKTLGIYDDIERAKNGTKVRAGRGKSRGRMYKQPRSILIVREKSEDLRAFSDLPGVDMATPESMSIRKLAPGGIPGRLTLFTTNALERIGRSSDHA